MVDATGLLDIYLFSLDVKGGELSVLRTLDLEATNIQVVVVELDGRSPDRDEEVRRWRAPCPPSPPPLLLALLDVLLVPRHPPPLLLTRSSRN